MNAAIELEEFAKTLTGPLCVYDFGGGNIIVPKPDTGLTGYLQESLMAFQGVLRKGSKVGHHVMSVCEISSLKSDQQVRGKIMLAYEPLKAAYEKALAEFLAMEEK